MPVYVYRCDHCGFEFEKRQSFSDSALTVCERCQGALHKVYSPAAIIYKGSGFYTTDYNGKSGGNGANGGGKDQKDGDSTAKKEIGEKSEPKAAAESGGAGKPPETANASSSSDK